MRKVTIFIGLLAVGSHVFAVDETAEQLIDCSAYFFMAANVKGMAVFNTYYTAGEYGYNTGVREVGEAAALARFNLATNAITELIERKWLDFGKADDKYGVVCADILREANKPD